MTGLDWTVVTIRVPAVLKNAEPVQQHNLPLKEYERAVIYRLGLMLPGGTQGPGESILHCPDVNLFHTFIHNSTLTIREAPQANRPYGVIFLNEI